MGESSVAASPVARQRASTRLPRRSSELVSWLSCLMSASSFPVFTWNKRVEFAETDAAGIAHFSSFFVYMEQAEHALFRSCGWSVFPRPARSSLDPAKSPPSLTWPRVHCSCDFQAPAIFEDQLTIDIYIDRIGTKSISYRHVVRRNAEILAEGKITVVCSLVDPTTHRILSCEIPDYIRDKLQSLSSGNSPKTFGN